MKEFDTAIRGRKGGRKEIQTWGGLLVSLRHSSHESIHEFIHPFIHSLFRLHSAWVPALKIKPWECAEHTKFAKHRSVVRSVPPETSFRDLIVFSFWTFLLILVFPSYPRLRTEKSNLGGEALPGRRAGDRTASLRIRGG